MGALGAWALAVGVADLIAPPDDGQRRSTRLLLASLALPTVAGLAGAGIGLSLAALLALALVSGLSGGLWVWLWRTEVHQAGLAILATAFVGLLVTAGHWDSRDAALARLLEGSPLVTVEPDIVLLVVGLAMMLVATGNRIVRIVLSGLERELLSQENQLRGGRVIGPLERLLIFGLGVSGQLVAAGLVVAAKSLLRFSEVRSREPEARDRAVGGSRRAELMSEYLLVGSLLSWSLAFLAVAVAVAPAAG